MFSYLFLIRYVFGQREHRAANELSLPHGTSAWLGQIGSIKDEVEYSVCLVMVDDHVDQLDKGGRRELTPLGFDVAKRSNTAAGFAVCLDDA